MKITSNFTSIAAPLLAWYDNNKRDLPWRENTDPYRIWVSEIMLQQTRVSAVIPYFEIEDGKLLPPFVAISGLGENAAWDLMKGREGKDFLSIEEIAAACPKVSKTHIQMLKDAGAFGDLPDTSQVSLF